MQIDLDGRMYEVRAKVMSLEGYSAHADQVGLIRFALGCKARRVVLVHGERRSKQLLAQVLASLFKQADYDAEVEVAG